MTKKIYIILGVSYDNNHRMTQELLRCFLYKDVALAELQSLKKNIEYDFAEYEIHEIRLNGGFTTKLYYLTEQTQDSSVFIDSEFFTSKDILQTTSKKWLAMLERAKIVTTQQLATDYSTLKINIAHVDIANLDEYWINTESDNILNIY